MKPCLTGQLLQYFKTQEQETGRLPVDAELTGVEKRESRPRDQRPERLTPKDSRVRAAGGSLVGILVKKLAIVSPLSLFSLNWFALRCETNPPDCAEGKSQRSALPKDPGHVFWSGEVPPRSATRVLF